MGTRSGVLLLISVFRTSQRFRLRLRQGMRSRLLPGQMGAGRQHETGKRYGNNPTCKFVENFNFRNADNLYTYRDLWQISLNL